MTDIMIEPGRMPLSAWRAIYHGASFDIDAAARPAVEAGARTVADIAMGPKAVYGINTGFGKLASTRIAPDDLALLQRNLVLSHAAGIGAALPADVVRLVMALKLASLARGASGVRWRVIALLAGMAGKGVLPVIPAQGSVGASGDLAPLAHMTAAMIGLGEAIYRGQRMAAADALAAAGLDPVELGPKEGLALLNGTQVSTALALKGLFEAEWLFQAALMTGAMSVDALRGADTPFDARIHALRGHQGQIDVAAGLRGLLEGSEIRASHKNCPRVQDPYSLRCQPQVMGACLDLLRQAGATLKIEANAVSDNPLVFAESGEVLSGGNFHAEPVAFAADILALAVAEIGALSERRMALLIDPALSDLPAFLVAAPGLNSGFMIAQVTAAALAAENKQKAAPGSTDSLPTSANQEDHVSMATHTARRLSDMTENLAGILAVEWLAAGQGIDFRRPLRTSPRLAKAHELLRSQVAFYDKDRLFAPDLAAAKALLQSVSMADVTGAALPKVEAG